MKKFKIYNAFAVAAVLVGLAGFQARVPATSMDVVFDSGSATDSQSVGEDTEVLEEWEFTRRVRGERCRFGNFRSRFGTLPTR